MPRFSTNDLVHLPPGTQRHWTDGPPWCYDPSATRVNQENRIKLMLAVAKERLNAPAEAKPLTAEEIAGGAPSLSHV